MRFLSILSTSVVSRIFSLALCLSRSLCLRLLSACGCSIVPFVYLWLTIWQSPVLGTSLALFADVCQCWVLCSSGIKQIACGHFCFYLLAFYSLPCCLLFMLFQGLSTKIKKYLNHIAGYLYRFHTFMLKKSIHLVLLLFLLLLFSVFIVLIASSGFQPSKHLDSRTWVLRNSCRPGCVRDISFS